MTIADDLGEQSRLTEVYGRLRLKLLDLSKKNRMLNYNLGSRSKRHLQIVDEVNQAERRCSGHRSIQESGRMGFGISWGATLECLLKASAGPLRI